MAFFQGGVNPGGGNNTTGVVRSASFQANSAPTVVNAGQVVGGGVVNAGYGGYGGGVVNTGYGGVVNNGYGGVVNAGYGGYGGGVVNTGYSGGVVNTGFVANAASVQSVVKTGSGNYANSAPVVRSASFQANPAPIIQRSVVNNGYGGGVVNAGSGNDGYSAGYSAGYEAGLKAGQAQGVGGGVTYSAPTTVSNSNYVPAGGYGGVTYAGATSISNYANSAPYVQSTSIQAPMTQGGNVTYAAPTVYTGYTASPAVVEPAYVVEPAFAVEPAYVEQSGLVSEPIVFEEVPQAGVTREM